MNKVKKEPKVKMKNNSDTNETTYKNKKKSHSLRFQILLSTLQRKPKEMKLENKILKPNI